MPYRVDIIYPNGEKRFIACYKTARSAISAWNKRCNETARPNKLRVYNRKLGCGLTKSGHIGYVH
jgi:hypothetical protein